MSTLLVGLFASGAALASAVSAFVWIRVRRNSPWGNALIVASLPLCVYAVMTVVIVKTTHPGEGIWTTSRLTPSVALTRGHEVYSTRTEGVVQMTMYPPMWVVSYLPVAVGATPAQVLRIGLILTLLFSFVPIVLLLVDGSPTVSQGILGSASFILASMWFDSLSYSLFLPHADAPSLGYAMGACWLTLRSGPLTGRRVALVALLAWFSVLSKQVMAPILVVLPLWFLVVHGLRPCLRLFGWLAVTGVGMAALLVPFFGLEGVLFNVLTIPARVPWNAGHSRFVMAMAVLADLLIVSVPLVLLLTICAVASVTLRSRSSASTTGLGTFLGDNSWTLPAGVAICMVPISVLGRVKMGGYTNTYSPTTYFLLAAAVLATIAVARRLRDHAGPIAHQAGLGAIALCAGILAVGGTARVVFDADSPLRDHPSQQAYDYLVGEDSRVYFPMHPLAHLLADGSYLHYSPSLYDREYLAGIPLPSSQRQNHLPVDPSMVCVDKAEETGKWWPKNYFTDYTRRIEVPSLGRWWWCSTRQPGQT